MQRHELYLFFLLFLHLLHTFLQVPLIFPLLLHCDYILFLSLYLQLRLHLFVPYLSITLLFWIYQMIYMVKFHSLISTYFYSKIIYDFKKSIEFNLKKSHSPAFYSIDIGVAESKLSAITKEIYGLSPKKIINEGIILKAKKLLAENELIIKEISEELGFTDAPHFVKFFKKETGMTPGQFKETL